MNPNSLAMLLLLIENIYPFTFYDVSKIADLIDVNIMNEIDGECGQEYCDSILRMNFLC